VVIKGHFQHAVYERSIKDSTKVTLELLLNDENLELLMNALSNRDSDLVALTVSAISEAAQSDKPQTLEKETW